MDVTHVLHWSLDHSIPVPADVPRTCQEYVAELLGILEAARQNAKDTLQVLKAAMLKRSNEKVTRHEFVVGDTVFLYSPCLGSNQSKKLARPWTGPYYIVAKPSPIHVRLRRVSDNKAVPNLVHVNRVKQYQNGPQMGDAPPPIPPPPTSPPLPATQSPASPSTLVSGPQVDGSARSSDGCA